MKKVLVLGWTGMLGSMVMKYLTDTKKYDIRINSRAFDARKGIDSLLPAIKAFSPDWIINNIGVTKPRLNSDKDAVLVNSVFPYLLQDAAQKVNANVLQIATDCVFAGDGVFYHENNKHDAIDIYGKSKSLGEVKADNFFNLRCSIIGPEKRNYVSLFEWFMKHKYHATVKGYTNHHWNGITTYAFARICDGIMTSEPALENVQHIIPANSVNKFELLQAIAESFERKDIIIERAQSPVEVDRTLSTIDKIMNNQLWSAAGYASIPSIHELIEELSEDA